MSVPFSTSEAPYDVNDISVYRLRFGRMIGVYLILALGVFWIILFMWFPLSSQSPSMSTSYPWVVLAGFFLFDLCASISLASLRTKLITSPWGIEYYDLGITLRAPWKSVVGFEEVRYVYRWVDSLVTSQPAEMSRFILASLVMSKQRYLPASDMDIEKICHSIPIGNFVNDGDSSLDKEIRRYAPQVSSYKEEQEVSSLTVTAETRDTDAVSYRVEAGASQSKGDVAVPVSPRAHLEDKTRRNLWKVIALGVVVAEVMFAFFVAPAIYRSAQPLLGATDPLPGKLFLKDANGPGDLSQNGKFLIVGSQVLTFPEGTSTFKASPTMVLMALSADGKLVAGSDGNENAFIWQVADGQLMQTLSMIQPITAKDGVAGRTMRAVVYRMAFSSDGKRLATIGPIDQIKVWNVDDGTLLSTMQSSEKTARRDASTKLLFVPHSQLLVSLIDGTPEVWRTQGGTLESKVDPHDHVMDMAISADGATLALGTLYGGIYLWDVRSGSFSKTIKERQKSGPLSEAIYGIAISPDGKTVVSGSSLGGMQVWSVDGGRPKSMRDSSGTTVRWMTFSPDGKLIYSKYNDRSIWVWANGLGAV